MGGRPSGGGSSGSSGGGMSGGGGVVTGGEPGGMTGGGVMGGGMSGGSSSGGSSSGGSSTGPSGGGSSSGGTVNPETPYKPFENNAVSWGGATGDAAAPFVSGAGGGAKPAILLFIGKNDAESCCAETFERWVFTDSAVLDLVPQFTMLRIDRATDPAKRFKVSSPAIIVLDSEADLIGRFDRCTNPESVIVTMKEALSRQKTIAERTAEFTPLLPKAEKLLKDGKVRDSSSIVSRAIHCKRLRKALRDGYARVEKSLEDLAAPRIDAAIAKDTAGDSGLSWTLLRDIKNDFLGLPAGARAEAAMHALEKDPAKKEKLREFRAESALDAAKALAEQGKKAEAITALRLIGTDFPGSRAAQDAKDLMKAISDPSWKPEPREKGGHDDSVDEAPASPSMGHDDSVDEPEAAPQKAGR